MADSFHQTSITNDDVGVVVNRAFTVDGTQMRLSDGHTYCVGESLTKRTGGDFNTCSVSNLGVSRCC